MGSILKRITPASQFNKRIAGFNSQIHFELDEPEFLLKERFQPLVKLSIRKTHNHTFANTVSCSHCGNSEVSIQAKFCRICGSEFLDA